MDKTKREICAWCGGKVNEKNRIVHKGRFNKQFYVFDNPSCAAVFIKDSTKDNS